MNVFSRPTSTIVVLQRQAQRAFLQPQRQSGGGGGMLGDKGVEHFASDMV